MMDGKKLLKGILLGNIFLGPLENTSTLALTPPKNILDELLDRSFRGGNPRLLEVNPQNDPELSESESESEIRSRFGDRTWEAFQAIHNNDIETLQRLIHEGLNVNAAYFLHVAVVAMANLEIVQLLLEHGADPNIPDDMGRLPLHYAMTMTNSNLEIIRLLLEYGADPNSLGNEHFWLRGAAFEESVPPLIYAVSKDNSEIIQLLSKHGAAIDWINRNGLTLLNIAIANERFEAAKALVDAGADVTAPNANGETAFDIVSKKEEEVLEEKQKYIDQLERMEAFFLAHGAIEGQPNEATETETPSPPNDYPPNFREEPNPPSETPDFPNEATDQEQERQRAMFREAHLAVVCYDIEGLKGLIREGFDVNMRVDGQTILHEVAALFREEMVVLLLNNGAEIDITDKRNWTPLFCAVYGRQLGTLKLLLKRGATVNRVDSDGNTPLHIATIEELRYPERRGESIGVLLDAGADVNAAAKDGCTPLDRVHRLRAKALEIWQNAINELNQRTAFLREHKRKGKQSEESGTAEGRLESNES